MEFVGLLGPHRESRATAKRIDRHPPGPVELETMAAWNVLQPAVRKLEIGRLEAKRSDHRRDVKMANRVP
jgi:hypothetical protein